MTAAYKIFKFSIVKNSFCDVIVEIKKFPFAKLFIEIIDNSQTKRVRDLKILPDLEQGLKTKISIFAKGNILRCSLLQNDGSIDHANFCADISKPSAFLKRYQINYGERQALI